MIGSGSPILAARIARRARKLVRGWGGAVAVPDSLKTLGSEVLDQTRAQLRGPRRCETRYGRRALIDGDRAIDRGYRRFRREMKDSLRHDPGQLDAWLQLMSIGRHLERIADHATGIAETVVYLEEGIIVRHETRDAGRRGLILLCGRPLCLSPSTITFQFRQPQRLSRQEVDPATIVRPSAA